ncbi:MAG: T9SS type A sorting domain-containing protein, partial [Bacteroidota bacterium]
QKNANLVTIDKDFYTAGNIAMGLSRIDQMSQSGYGKIARISIIMVDDISGKDLLTDTFQLRIQSTFMIRQNGDEVPLQAFETRIPISQEVETHLDSPIHTAWDIHINPTRNHLLVQSSTNTPIQGTIRLIGLDGKTYHQLDIRKQRHQIPLTHLANGVYIVQIQTETETTYRKFFWMR